MPIGADVILRQFLDVALEAGPNSQHWRELREHAGIVVDMALAGEWNNALRSSHLVVPGHASGPPRGSWSA